MRLLPRSLSGRLLVTAVLTMLPALAFAAFAIGHVLERFVMHGLDERLDAQIAVVSRAIRPDGSIARGMATDVPPFDEAGSGWAWQIDAPGGSLHSGSLGPMALVLPRETLRHFPPGCGLPQGDRRMERHERERPHPFEGIDANGIPIHFRIRCVETERGMATVIAAGPRAVVDRPLRAALLPLALSLAALGAALLIALLVQLKVGLRPIEALRRAVAEVRAGTRSRVVADEPTELLPLVEELNALIDANEAALARARGHVANLAHGLKTPLAGLRLDLAGAVRDPDGQLTAQVEKIERQIRHHLGRARAASPAAGRIGTPLASHVRDLVETIGRIHADRAITVTIAMPETAAVRCDPQDLDEMLGNLIDNGWRWARSAIAITARPVDGLIEIAIGDDGPGLSPEELDVATQAGRRLDEQGDGPGFGLTIARELAELYGGELILARAPSGGLSVSLRLPAAAE